MQLNKYNLCFKSKLLSLLIVFACMSGFTQAPLPGNSLPKDEELSALFRPMLDNNSVNQHSPHRMQKKELPGIHLPMPAAFFCRMEHTIEKRSRIPFRFRLGALNYVNKLENKEKDF